MRCEHGVTAAINKTQNVVVCDLLAETDATRAEDTAFVIKCDSRTNRHIFRFLDLVLEKTRLGITKVNAELLQSAFPRLIADWAIERMID